MSDPTAGLFQLAANLATMGKEIVTGTDAAKRNAQLIEFQTALIGLNSMVANVQQDNVNLRREKDAAEEALKRMQDWSVTKQRYAMATPFRGCTVFALRKEMSGGEPAHYLCAACFTKGRGSILQGYEGKATKTGGREYGHFYCNECRSEAHTTYMDAPGAKYFEDIPPLG